MVSAAVVHGTNSGGAHAAHPFSLHWAATELIQSGRGIGVPLESISISEVGANGASQMSFTTLDAQRVLSLPALGRVQLTHNTPNEILFAGFAMGRRTIPWAAGGYQVETTATDYSYLLDTIVVPALNYKAGHSDRALIQGVVAAAARHPHIATHTSLLTSTNSNMPGFAFSHITLRAAIEAIQAAAGEGRHYYVDFLGRLHYYSGATESGMGAAPYAVTDSPSGADRAPSDLVIEYDDSQIANCVYIFGGAPAGSGWEKDEASIKLYGLRQGTFDAPHCKDATHRASVGRHFLGLHKDPIVRGSFSTTTTDTGWRVGQTVTVTFTQFGLSAAPYPISQIDTVFHSGTGMRTRTIHFGDLPASGRRRANIHPMAAASSGGPLSKAALLPPRVSGYTAGLRDRVIH